MKTVTARSSTGSTTKVKLRARLLKLARTNVNTMPIDSDVSRTRRICGASIVCIRLSSRKRIWVEYKIPDDKKERGADNTDAQHRRHFGMGRYKGFEEAGGN